MIDWPAHWAAFQATHPPQTRVVDQHHWGYLAGGQGDPLVLLPGLFGVAGTDFLYIQALEQQYRIISVTYPDSLRQVSDLADGLAGLLDQLGIARARVLGGSYSGYVAQVLVRRHPHRVAALILAETGAPRRRHVPLAWALVRITRTLPPAGLRWALKQTVRHFLPQATPAQAFWRAYFYRLLAAVSLASLTNRFAVVLDYHRHYVFTPDDLTAWPGSLLILEAVQDTLLSAEERACLRRFYPQAEYRQIPGDHTRAVDQPAAQIAAIQEFLGSSM